MLANYQLGQTLYQSGRVTVVRAQRRADALPVVLKIFSRPQSGAEELSRIRREYEIHAGLKHPGVAEAFSLQRDQHRWYIEMEDFGGHALGQGDGGPHPLPHVLQIGAQLAEVLAFVHSRGVVHKDVNPANVLFNAQTGKIKLIDFGIATTLQADTTQFYDLNQLEGTLPYLSPEQTGRMNRAVDTRSDFYSLGATLYELLTGQPPFLTTNPMELIHSHLAKRPVPAHEIRPEVPKTVSMLVQKLLAKDPEDRYQTAPGIRADLLQAAQYLAQGTAVDFPLGLHDVADALQIPKKLYGRKVNAETLLGVFDRVSQGANRLVLVSGPAGIGKSTLVHELYKPLTTHRSYFISGKFDQLQRNTPYQAIIVAVQHLVRHLLTEDSDAVQAWKHKILAAVGAHGRVVTDVVPEAQLILGEQQPLPEVGPKEAKHRFERVFQRFVGSFCGVGQPLVVFLDDLQWADRGSIDLLRAMITAPETAHLMVIAAYREDEVNAEHPFERFVDELRQSQVALDHLVLAPLGEPEITQWLQDMLRAPADRVQALATVSLHKTAGNPFFLAEYFKSLANDQVLLFNAQAGQWHWDMERVRQSATTSNVADLLLAKFKRLAPAAQQLLQVAAMVGNRFELAALAALSNAPEQTLHATAVALHEAVQVGMVVPQSAAHELLTLDAQAADMQVEYKFAHDRVQQEIYNTIAAAPRAQWHHQLAVYLTAHMASEGAVFEVVNHYHAARALLQSETERLSVASLSLHAGTRAAESAAYAPALQYFRSGIELLDGVGSGERHDVALQLHLEAARMAMLTGEFAQMDTWVDTVCHQVQRPEDVAAALEVRMLGLSSQGKITQALQVGLDILRRLGAPLPQAPKKLHVLGALAKTRWLLRGTHPETPLASSPMANERALMVARCSGQMLSAAYYASSDLYALLVLLNVQLAHRFGNAPGSPFAWAAYGTLICLVFKNYTLGYRYTQMAERMAEQLGDPQRARIGVLLHGFVGFWQRPVSACARALLTTHQDCIDVGDTEYACHALYIGAYNRFFGGEELSKLDAQMQIDANAMARLNQERSLTSLRIWWQGVRNLRGQAQNLWCLRGDVYDESVMLPKFRETHNIHGLANTFVVRLILCYLFDRIDEAVENARLAEQSMGVFKSVSVPSWYHFYAALTHLAAAEKTMGPKRRRNLALAACSTRLLAHWAHEAPINHTAKSLLVQGEQARIHGRWDSAEALLERGIAAAQEAKFVSEEAVGYELLAKVYRHKQRPQLRIYFLHQAYATHGQWGATAKMQAMELVHPELAAAEVHELVALRTDITHSPTTRKTANLFDMESVFRASQAISGIIDLRALSERLMTLVMENAGAQRGVLLLVNAERLTLAMDSRDSKATPDMQPLELSTQQARTTVPLDIVNYVRRTQHTVVLPGEHDALFAHDPYVQMRAPRSILCLPLLNQGTINGVLYLENDLVVGAFTDRRVSLLQLLSSQVALAIDNARLYGGLEQQVHARTRELQESQAKVLRLQKTALETQLAGGFAHEMRNALSASGNLLGTVIGNDHNVCDATAADLQLLLHTVRPILPADTLARVNQILLRVVMQQEQLQEALEGVSLATVRAQRITSQILDYAQLGRMEKRQAAISLRSVLEEVSHDFANRHKGEPNAVGLSIDPLPTDLHVWMDENHLFAVLRNLVANARDSIQETKRPEGNIRVQVQHLVDTIVLKVTDNGGGMSERVQKRLFEPFFTTKGVRGTGLGLGIVKRITELYDGSLQFSTRVGTGTEFTVTLPTRQQDT